MFPNTARINNNSAVHLGFTAKSSKQRKLETFNHRLI